jgi:hypothetical protein
MEMERRWQRGGGSGSGGRVAEVVEVAAEDEDV